MEQYGAPFVGAFGPFLVAHAWTPEQRGSQQKHFDELRTKQTVHGGCRVLTPISESNRSESARNLFERVQSKYMGVMLYLD